MAKSPDAFRTISEVADWLGIQAHVLRFWESKFAPVKPVKRAGGRRYYRPADMLLLGGIKRLLHDDGMTIKGVQEMLREQGIGHVSALSQSIDEPAFSIEVEIEDVSATVLQFQSNSEVDSVAAPEATQDASDSVHADQDEEHEAVETEELTEPDTVAEPDEDITSVVPEEQPETATLPSFLSRSADQDEVAETTKPAPLAPQPDIPRAVVVDAPDPGPDDSQNYSPGSLGQLAGLDYLTAEQVERITPLANELRAWLTRTDAA
jgi:DNA-binding transcriptional MerR regulator